MYCTIIIILRYFLFLCKSSRSLPVSVCPSLVQEDVEQGAVPFVRDESLREPGVRIHLHYLSR